MTTKAPTFEEPGQDKPGVATTTAQAKATKAPFLSLSSLKLTQLPEGLDALRSLTNIDISNNAITSIPEKGLPSSLVELTVTGCQLTELPSSIGTLPKLKKLFAGANKLERIDPVFRSKSLQHAGLAYNRVAALPTEEVLSASPLLSLDLSHNDLEGLMSNLDKLAALPSLAALSLSGNPLVLAPRYTMEARGRLKQLLYLDGQRLDLPANSRPGTANSVGSSRHLHHQQGSTNSQQQQGGPAATVAAAAAALGPVASGYRLHGLRSLGGGLGGGAPSMGPQTVRFFEGVGGGGDCVAVTLTLRGLQPAEDPFGWLKRRWDEQIKIAEELGMTVPPTMEVPVPPLQPVIYHLETTDVEGTPLACVPLRLVPPTPPDVAVMFDPKAKAAAAAAAAKAAKQASKPATPSKGKKGKGAPVPAEAAVQRPLETGLLRFTLPIRPVAAHRNWLRSGVTVTMYKTTLTANPRPPTAPDAGEGAGGKSKQGAGATGRKKKGDEPAPVEYDITSSTEAIGSAVLRAGGSIVDGYTVEASEKLDFLPAPPLFDDKGIRLALRDPRHPSEPVGHVEVTVRLHMPPPGSQSGWEG